MFDQLQGVFKSLNSHEVRYLVIGGMAMLAHGGSRATFDLDLVIEPTLENARRLLQAFLEAGLGTASLTTPEQLVAHEITIFKDFVRIDVQTATPGITFESAWQRRLTMTAQGQPFHVLSRADLLASKRAAGRPKDIADANELDLP